VSKGIALPGFEVRWSRPPQLGQNLMAGTPRHRARRTAVCTRWC